MTADLTTLLAEFRVRFPEFSKPKSDTDPNPIVSDARIELYLNDSINDSGLSESYWGKLYNLGVLYYSAHCLAVAMNTLSSSSVNSDGSAIVSSKATGRISSASVGGISTSYDNSGAISNSNDFSVNFLSLTPYGVQFLSYLQNLQRSGYKVCSIF